MTPPSNILVGYFLKSIRGELALLLLSNDLIGIGFITSDVL